MIKIAVNYEFSEASSDRFNSSHPQAGKRFLSLSGLYLQRTIIKKNMHAFAILLQLTCSGKEQI